VAAEAAAAAAPAENGSATAVPAASAATRDKLVVKGSAQPPVAALEQSQAAATTHTAGAKAKAQAAVALPVIGSDQSAIPASPAKTSSPASAATAAAAAEVEVGVVKPMRVKSAGETVEVTYRVHIPEGRLKELQERKRRQEERAQHSHAHPPRGLRGCAVRACSYVHGPVCIGPCSSGGTCPGGFGTRLGRRR
jgi:hypothetical protein